MNDLLRNPTVLGVLVAVLVLWRVYVRARRLMRRQQLSRVRPWVTIAVFSLLLILLGTAVAKDVTTLVVLAGGAFVGAILGYVGHRLTKFEQTPEGDFYTPNAHLGIALSLLFVGRIVYRFVKLYLSHGALPTSRSTELANPFTLGIFAIMAGYYVVFAIGLVWWRARGELSNSQAT